MSIYFTARGKEVFNTAYFVGVLNSLPERRIWRLYRVWKRIKRLLSEIWTS